MAVEKIILSLITDAADARKDIEKVGKATRDAQKDTTIWGASMNKVNAAMLKVKRTAKVLFGSIKAGLLSTGIGVFVIAIGSLVAYFTQTKKGAEQFSKALNIVGSVVKNIIDRLGKLGGAIVKLLKGDFKGAAKEAKAAMTGFKKEVIEDANTIAKLTDAMQKNADAQRDLNVKTAESVAFIEQQKLIAEDITKSYEVRKKAAETAFAKEKELEDERIKLAEERVKLMKEEMATGENTAEDLDALAEAEIELANIRQEAAGRQISLQNFLNGLNKEFADKRQARRDKEEQDKKDKEAEEKKRAEEKAKEEEDAAKLKEEKIKANNAKLIQLQNEQILAEAENQFERARIQANLDEERALSEVENVEGSEELKTAIRDKYRKIREGIAQAETDTEIALEEQKAAAVASTLGNLAALAGEGTETFKALKLAETIINTASSAQAAYNSTVGIPVVGPVLAPINAGLAIAAGMKQVDTIMQTKIPEAKARGGIIRGYGSGTSDSIPARLSRGEVVINAKSAKAFRPLLSSINVAGGGVGFARGGATTPDMGRALDLMSPDPVKAFVLTDEMSSSQERLSKIRRRASI